MPLRRLPGPPDLERVVAVLGGSRPLAPTSGWVPGAPVVVAPQDGDGRDAAVPPAPEAVPWPSAEHDPEAQRMQALPSASVAAGIPRRGVLQSTEQDTARLDADLRARRRPQVFTVPEALRHGRVAVSSSAVVAVLALVIALACAFALRVLWAERSASAPMQPLVGGTGGVSVQRASSATASEAAAPAPSTTTGAATQLIVHVVGQVRHPGLVRLRPGARVADAITAAGGATARADLSLLNLARPVVDGEQVRVPRPGELVTSPGTVGGAASGTSGSTSGAGSGGTSLVNLNTADLAALDTLPGVGPVLAQRIIDWRAEHGRFSSVQELGEVSGIGDKLYAQLQPKVTV